MSIFTTYIRGFNENKFWKIYKSSRSGNIFKRLLFTSRYMRMATKRGGYIGRETLINGKIHFPHGLNGVHISRYAIIGKNATIFQNVTIGQTKNGAPQIGDNVLIGANAVVIGPIKIGNNVCIGAGAVVGEDIPDNCTVVSEKAKIIKRG